MSTTYDSIIFKLLSNMYLKSKEHLMWLSLSFAEVIFVCLQTLLVNAKNAIIFKYECLMHPSEVNLMLMIDCFNILFTLLLTEHVRTSNQDTETELSSLIISVRLVLKNVHFAGPVFKPVTIKCYRE